MAYWIALVAGGLLEIGWAVCLKHSDGLTRPLPAVATVVLLAGSVALSASGYRQDWWPVIQALAISPAPAI